MILFFISFTDCQCVCKYCISVASFFMVELNTVSLINHFEYCFFLLAKGSLMHITNFYLFYFCLCL